MPGGVLRAILPGLALATLLLGGLAYAPSAKATIQCLASQTGAPRMSAGFWTPLANYYEVPVGGVLTSATATLRTRIRKTGTNRDEIYLRAEGRHATGSAYHPEVEAYDSPLTGVGLRMRVRTPSTGDDVVVGRGDFDTGHVSFEGEEVADYTHIQEVSIEFVRLWETLPPGTQWWGLNNIFSLPIMTTLRFSTDPASTLGAACGPITIRQLSGMATGVPTFPYNPPREITCTLDINNGNPQVNFGSIQLRDLATVGQPATGSDKVPVDVAYACRFTPNASTPNYTISWHGTAATGQASALQVTDASNREKAGLGIVMESGDPPQVLELNTGRVAAPNAGLVEGGVVRGSSVRLYAYPIRTDNSQITTGPFRGTATIRINLF